MTRTYHISDICLKHAPQLWRQLRPSTTPDHSQSTRPLAMPAVQSVQQWPYLLYSCAPVSGSTMRMHGSLNTLYMVASLLPSDELRGKAEKHC